MFQKGVIVIISVLICLTVGLESCATGPSRRIDDGAKNLPQNRGEQKLQLEEFGKNNPRIVSQMGDLKLTIRMVTGAEISGDQSKAGTAVSDRSGSLALGLLAPPMFASSLVIGGIILVPLGSYAYFHEKGIWKSIDNALVGTRFTQAVDEAMRRRLNRAFAYETIPKLEVEIRIEILGILKPADRDRNCLVAAAVLELSRYDTDVMRYHLNITALNRSPDAPPPYCATLEHFAKDEAQLVKDTLAEYTEVLAAMGVEENPWRRHEMKMTVLIPLSDICRLLLSLAIREGDHARYL